MKQQRKVFVIHKFVYVLERKKKMNEILEQMGKKANVAKQDMIRLNTNQKNHALKQAAAALTAAAAEILEANKTDVENGRKNGMKKSLIDRLSRNLKCGSAARSNRRGFGYVQKTKWHADWQTACSAWCNRHDL